MMMAVCGCAAMAQDSPWDKELTLGLKVLQSSYSDNWNSGEKGSIVWTGDVAARLEKQYSKNVNWRNTLKLVYGQTTTQDRDAQGNLVWSKPDKTDDIIEVESILRRSAAGGWGPFAAFRFTTLFQDLTDAEGRALNLTPLTFSESLGASKLFVDEEHRRLLTRLGAAYKQNSRRFYPFAAPSLATQLATSAELAVEWVTEYRVGALDKRVDWDSKLTVSRPLIYSGKSVFEDGFTSIAVMPADIAAYTTTTDIDWENTFTSQITKVISVKLYVRWVYDKYDNTVKPVVDDTGKLTNEADVLQAVRRAGQFKQTLALGLGYTFN